MYTSRACEYMIHITVRSVWELGQIDLDTFRCSNIVRNSSDAIVLYVRGIMQYRQ